MFKWFSNLVGNTFNVLPVLYGAVNFRLNSIFFFSCCCNIALNDTEDPHRLTQIVQQMQKAIVASNLQPQSSIRINIFICCSHSVDWRLAIAFPIALLDRINHTLVCVVRPTIRTTLQPDTLRASSAVANAPSEWKTWIDRNCGATGMQACAFHMYILHDLIVHWRCQFTLPYTIYYYESTNSVSSKYICKWMNNNNKYKKKVATTHRDARWICMNEQKSAPHTHTQGDCFIMFGVAPALEVNFKRYNISSGQKKKRSNHLANNERHMKNGGKS